MLKKTNISLEQPLIGQLAKLTTSTVPDGWLLSYGQAISRTTYARLFEKIGTTYGAGDGSTTFNLPDCRGRVLVGKDDMGGTAAGRMSTNVAGSILGASGGSEAHTLSVAQMASHPHDMSHNHGTFSSGTESADHAHSVYGGTHLITDNRVTRNASLANVTGSGPNAIFGSSSGSLAMGSFPINNDELLRSPDHTHSVGGRSAAHYHNTTISTYNSSTGSNGSNAAHNNTQPSIIVNYIIKY